jgi:DNA-binding transcriptional ArsR family regulator
MGRRTIAELKAAGVSQADLDAGRQFQEAQRRAGRLVQPLAVVVGFDKPNVRTGPKVVDINDVGLRRQGTYEQAARLLSVKALEEKDPERQAAARELAAGVNRLAAARQIEFNFFGGNVTLAHAYQDAITERLAVAAPTLAKRNEAHTVLGHITRHLEWQNFTCTKSAADLCDITGIAESHMSRTLQLLEDVGAIHRVKRGRTKVIAVTPEGAYRGRVDQQPAAVERFRLEVVEGGKGKAADAASDRPTPLFD